jgi:hypothetical protein
MNPSLLEQVLQATPPSLKANEKVPAGQAVTQSFPLATKPLLQLAQILLGSTPTETYTREKLSRVLEAEMVRT